MKYLRSSLASKEGCQYQPQLDLFSIVESVIINEPTFEPVSLLRIMVHTFISIEH